MLALKMRTKLQEQQSTRPSSSRAGKGRLPDLIVLGWKSGTTSLHHYLNQHPDIRMSDKKELDFFTGRPETWGRGLEWYASQFTGPEKIQGETTPGYTDYPRIRGCAERMQRVLPEARLVYLVRDPIRRIVSHYYHECRCHRAKQPLNEALQDPEHSPVVQVSRYALQLEQYLRYYSLDSIHVLSLEELQNEFESTMRSLFRFLGVDEEPARSIRDAALNQDEGIRKKRIVRQLERKLKIDRLRPLFPLAVRDLYGKLVMEPIPQEELSERTESLLRDYLREDVAEFRKMTGRPFSEWSL